MSQEHQGPRVAYLVQQFTPEVGAGPARVSEMAARWSRAGAMVTVVTAMPNRPEGRIHSSYRGRLFALEEGDGIRVLRSWLYARPGGGLLTTLLNNVSFLFTSLLLLLRQAGPIDVLIASSPPWFPHIGGTWFGRWRGVPLVLEVRDLWPDYLVEMGIVRQPWVVRALLGYERRLLLRADHVVVVTEGLRQRVLAKGIPSDRVTLITNGVDPAQYYPSTESTTLPELQKSPGEFLVGYLGNFGAGQSLGCVLEAAGLLRGSHPQVRFVLVGDGTEYPRIRAMAERLALPNVALRGVIPKEETRAFYNACDLCLVPLAALPVFEGALPSKMFEMMACGRPVLAQSTGEAALHLARSGAGWSVAPGDAAALAGAIGRIAGMSPEERHTAGAGGVEYVGRHFNRDALAARFLEVLRALSSDGRRR